MSRIFRPQHQRLINALLILSGSFLPTSILAQEAVATETPGILVADSGNRLIYTADYFSQFNVVTASDQLDRIPGIQDIVGGGGGGGGGGDWDGGGQRGFGSGGDQVLINGARVSGKSNDIGSVLDRIQARQVLQIEVIRGAVPGLDVRSQGRVVNVVLTETLSTGYGAWTTSLESYGDDNYGGGGELSYNGDFGSLNYLLSLEGDLRREVEASEDRFYTPGNVLFERQVEDAAARTEDYTLSANLSYSLLSGNLLNLNTLYGEETEEGNEQSADFEVVADTETFDGGRLSDDDESATSWEIGGDYQHGFANGNRLTTIFIYSRSSSDEESASFDLDAGGDVELEDVQLESSLSIEKIVRSSYEWSLGENHQFESGFEVALNRVEEAATLFEATNGVLATVPDFSEASLIEETRYEAFTSYSRQISERMSLEGSLDLEYSELHQDGDELERTRDFFYPKPRVTLSYDLNDTTQVRGRLERTVSQLDFGDFVSSFTNDDNRFDVISAGNPELVPEKAWELEFTYERQLPNDSGVLTVTTQYADIEDPIGRIPLLLQTEDGPEVRTAPGNLEDGYTAELEISGSLRLDGWGLANAVLDLSWQIEHSQVPDPFTGEEREFNGAEDYRWSLDYRQDVDSLGFSYGFGTGNASARNQYDLDYRQIQTNDLDLEFFVEKQLLTNLSLRLEAESLLRAESQRERLQFEGDRRNTPLERRELRTSQPFRQISLSIQGVF